MVISPNMHVCICFLHRFWIWFQPWWWLCNPESMLPQYMIWLSSGSVFWSDFNRDSDYVIPRSCDCNTWYGHHQMSFPILHSTYLAISQNIHVCVCFLHHFSIRFQPWWWLCNLESILPQYYPSPYGSNRHASRRPGCVANLQLGHTSRGPGC